MPVVIIIGGAESGGVCETVYCVGCPRAPGTVPCFLREAPAFPERRGGGGLGPTCLLPQPWPGPDTELAPGAVGWLSDARE